MKLCRGFFGNALFHVLIWTAGLIGISLSGYAQINSWTSSASGHWEDSTWSLGIPPSTNQTVFITNAPSKAVGIFPTTPINFPGTMTVNSFAISGPDGTVNTLLLNYFGSTVPLEVLNDCNIGTNGRIISLSSGLSIGGFFTIATNGSFVQQGGNTVANEGTTIYGTVAVTNAALSLESAEMFGQASFTQSGGSVGGAYFNITSGATYNLLDGLLSPSTLAVGQYESGGTFNQYGGQINTPEFEVIGGNGFQYGGTNYISNFFIEQAYSLSGGLLWTADTDVNGIFIQNGGVCEATNLFDCTGDYTLSSGTLISPELIVDFGVFTIGSGPVSISLSNFYLDGGIVRLSNSSPHFPALNMNYNCAIDFGSGSSKVFFAKSTALSWSGTLTISNWSGSTAGGGADQLVFGNDANGLTLRQLLQIQFVNPAGFPAGTWLATMLPTGEVVPTTSPDGPLQPNSWTSSSSGRWEDLTWSLGIPPSTNQVVLITNAGSKAVGIFPSTPVNSPATMHVGDLVVSAPAGTENTLLLNFSGTSTPLWVSNDCTIGTNGRIVSLSSGLRIGWDFFIGTNGSFTQQDGVTVATNGNFTMDSGTMALTNSAFSFTYGFLSEQATFDLAGGNVSASGLDLTGGSTFNLVNGNGSFSASVFIDSYPASTLNQYGGQISSPVLDIPGGNVFQYGGTSVYGYLYLDTGAFDTGGYYSLSNGVLAGADVYIGNGEILQTGGQVTISDYMYVEGIFEYGGDYGPPIIAFGDYNLKGGLLACKGFSVYQFGSFYQSGGTNAVTNDIDVAYYTLSGGLLSESNAFIRSSFIQSNGVHQVGGELDCQGNYNLSGGTLSAPTFVLDGGSLGIGPGPAVFSNAVAIRLFGGKIILNGTTQHLASVSSFGGTLIDFGSAGSKLSFDNSNGPFFGLLTITNWNGSATGGGSDQLFFGNSASGLTSAQLQNIQFLNPAGFPAGTWFAKILPTGEVVPTRAPALAESLSGPSVVITWPAGNFVLQATTNLSGPFSDISVLSPFTNDTTQYPRRFFRLKALP
jgi:hypothetical protein